MINSLCTGEAATSCKGRGPGWCRVEVVRAGLFEDDAPEYRADDVGADEDTRHTQDRDQLGLS